MAWHDDKDAREAFGKDAEKEFQEIAICTRILPEKITSILRMQICGGSFEFVGHLRPGIPDFKCKKCGRMVEVKAKAPDAQWVNISQRPFDGYAEDVVIAIRDRPGLWFATTKKLARWHGPFEPKHSGRGSTWYYVISRLFFFPPSWLGLQMKTRAIESPQTHA